MSLCHSLRLQPPPSYSLWARGKLTNVCPSAVRYDDLSWTSTAPNDPHDPVASSTLVSSTDPSLSSYAQLGVYRLHTSRALISLFDRDRQHIIAEAVENSPIAPTERVWPQQPNNEEGDDYFQHSSQHKNSVSTDGDDGFWLCGTAIPRSFGICEHVLLGAGTGGNGSSVNELPVSVVPDLAAHPRFQDRPYIHGKPYNRFYAGVPIRSSGPNGVNIGVYCVFGTTPRPQGLSSDEVKFMQDISRTVMGYLECRETMERFRKSERMVRGMGNFVNGSDSLSSSASGRGHAKKASRAVNLTEIAADDDTTKRPFIRNKRPEALSKGLGVAGRLFDEALLSPRTPNPPTPATPWSNKTSPGSEIPVTPAWMSSHIQAQSLSNLVPEDLSRSSTPRPESQQSDQRSPKPAVLSEVSTADLKLVETGQVFAKAANIIRQSLDIDGVLFLDATVRSFGGLIGPNSERKTSAVGMDSLNYLSDDMDSTPASSRDNFCPVLGYATPKQSTIQGHPVPVEYEGLQDKTLQRLLKRYPNGRILNFEANGEIVSTSDSPLDRPQPSPSFMPLRRPASPKREWSRDSRLSEVTEFEPGDASRTIPAIRRQRSSAAGTIIHLIPEARSVVIIPLWDRQKKRWVAGGFAWTKDPTRIFTSDGTLSFLRVFGMIAMAEIYRLDTKAEETMKSNILGSISHELRSPLHGLVGAVELLNDSKLDAVQLNVLSIIETSGKTLVDTINHLLDYSKINSFLDKPSSEKSARPTDIATPVELDLLVEEVVESVLAGYSHERRAVRDDTEYRRYADALGGQIRQTAPADRVEMYLDIQPKVSWRYPAHPGAFRRIVMNLFGNALKFTTSGFIKISLSQDPANRAVLLTVADSGKGISEEYLQNGLFTPFCQEDNFAPGTGLGLSLVRQITVNLGGEVKVASQLGRGTTITVSLPFADTKDELQPDDPTGSKKEIDRLKGLKVMIRGFEGFASSDSEVYTPGPATVGRLADSQAQALESTCRDWLQMQILTEANNHQPDFIIHHDPGLLFEDAEAIGMMATCPVLFVCEQSVAARNFSANLADAHSRIRTFEFFSPPLGPRKLAKGLVHLLDMWKVKQEENEPPHATTSASIEVVAKNTEPRIVKMNGKDAVVSAEELEVGDGVRVFKSAETSVVATQTVQYMASALPTPPEDSRGKDPMSTSERLVTEVTEGNSSEQGPAVLIVDDNAINMKVSLAQWTKPRPSSQCLHGHLDPADLFQLPCRYSQRI